LFNFNKDVKKKSEELAEISIEELKKQDDKRTSQAKGIRNFIENFIII